MEDTLKNILEELKLLNNRVGSLEKGQQSMQSDVKAMQTEIKSVREDTK